MKSHELMLISVYPEMLEDIQAVCQTMHIEPTILQWEIAQQGLLDKLNQMFLELPKPDVIISRGATAGMIMTSGLGSSKNIWFSLSRSPCWAISH